jgi:2-polyprenyl-6-hydroxyphenyl methylase/3-demethylubiquinone-9 3-methyltransferase
MSGKAAPLTDLEAHFAFGENWAAYEKGLTPEAIGEAVAGFARLLPRAEVEGRRVLDIGCGSGLHALAALRLGAASVLGIDLDPASAATAAKLLAREAPDGPWRIEAVSVFDSAPLGQFDIVYSWGVLHHTGAMAKAIAHAADRVAPGGLLCVALYRKTPLCALWRWEKALYAKAGPGVRRALEAAYVGLFRLALAVRGRSFEAYVSAYHKNRGMNWRIDVRDWLGGYPYESISENETLAMFAGLGFEPVRRFCAKPGAGVVGTGCDEYVFRKAKAGSARLTGAPAAQ